MELHNFPNLSPSDGDTAIEIWYFKDEFARQFLCGEKPKEFDPRGNLSRTHILLGIISGTSIRSELPLIDRLYYALQGENWSPNGEANEFITKKDLGHTSMSTGDIIRITMIGANETRDIYHCKDLGWTRY